jgi:hypothetical protein
MRLLIGSAVVLVALNVAAPAEAQVDSPEARAIAAQRYFQVTPIRELLPGMAEEMAKRLPPDQRAAFQDALVRRLNIELLETAAKASLAKHFTLAEINFLTEMMQRPEGKSAMNKMKYYMADLAPVIQQEIMRIANEARPVTPRVETRSGLSVTIPESAGYSPQFAALHERPESEDAAIVRDLKPRLDRVTYPYLYEYARRVASTNPEEAVVTFWRAGIRARYDAARCTDKTAVQGISAWPPVSGKALELARSPEYKTRTKEMMLRAAALEENVNIDYEPSTICFHGMSAIQAGMDKKPLENWHVPRSEWPQVHQKLLQSVRDAANRSP